MQLIKLDSLSLIPLDIYGKAINGSAVPNINRASHYSRIQPLLSFDCEQSYLKDNMFLHHMAQKTIQRLDLAICMSYTSRIYFFKNISHLGLISGVQNQ